MVNEIEIDELNIIVQYSHEVYPGNGKDEPPWEDFGVKWIKNAQSLDYMERKSFSNEEWEHIMRCILEHDNRQGKEREFVSVPDADRVLPGDSGNTSEGDREESKDNGNKNAKG